MRDSPQQSSEGKEQNEQEDVSQTPERMNTRLISAFIEDATAALASENRKDFGDTASNFVGRSIGDLPTPCLVVDEDVVKRNCERMLAKAREAGVKLRPHVKTHKTVEIAELQVCFTSKGQKGGGKYVFGWCD